MEMLDNAHMTIRIVENKPRHDVIYSLIEAPDGTVYLGLCGETGKDGCYAQILSYDKEAGNFKTLVDLAKVIPHPADDIRPPHSKLHTTFNIASDGKLLASTHMTAPPINEDFYHYWNIYNDPDRCYLGSHLVIYDPKTGSAEDFGVIMPKGGARWMTYNPDLEEVYTTSFLTCHFFVIKLKTGEIRDLGRISEHDWLGPCYCPLDGCVYTTDSLGNFFKYSPKTGTIEQTPLTTPRAPWAVREASGIFNLVANPVTGKLYGSSWNTMHVFELDPTKGKCGEIRDYGTIGGEEMRTEYSVNMRFPRFLTVGYDNKIYINGADYIGAKKDYPRLFTIDCDTGEQKMIGPISADGFPRFGGTCSSCASRDGSIYFGGNPTACGLTAMYIYSPDGKNRPLPDGYDKYRNLPPAKPDKWMAPDYHPVSRVNNAVFACKGTFLAHEEGMSGCTPMIPRGDMAISNLANDPITGTVFGTTNGKQCRLFAFEVMIKHFQPLNTFGREGDFCNAMAMNENGKLYFGTSNPNLPGELYCYDTLAARPYFINKETCDRGEFCEYCTIPPTYATNIVLDKDLTSTLKHEYEDAPQNEGYAAMICSGGHLYALTNGGFFLDYDLEAGTFESYDIFRKYLQEKVNISKVMGVYGTEIFFAGHHGNIITFDTLFHEFTDTKLKVPCAAGREYLNTITALVDAGDGIFYGGTLSDGYIFRLNMAEKKIINLGKPTFEGEIRGMTLGKDGILWGLAGRKNDLTHLFSYNPETGEYTDHGVMRAKMPYTWVIQKANKMLTGLDGEIYIGETDDISHLITFFPPIR